MENCCDCATPPPCVVLVASQIWFGFERFGDTLKNTSRQTYLTINAVATWDTSIFGSGGTITLDPFTGNVTFLSDEGGLGGLNWPGFTIDTVSFNGDHTVATVTFVEGPGYTLTFTLSDLYDIGDFYSNTVSLLNAQSMAGIPDNTTRTVFYVQTAPLAFTYLDFPTFITVFPTMTQWAGMTTDSAENTDHFDVLSGGGCPSCIFGVIECHPTGGLMNEDSGKMTIEKMQIRSQTGHHACQADTFLSDSWICAPHTTTGESTSGRGTQLDNCIVVNESGGNINISECGFDPTVTVFIGGASEQYGLQGCERRVRVGYTPSATASGCPCIPG